MKTNLLGPLPVALCAMLLFANPAAAQVPQLVNYQGRVAVGTPAVNFNGAGQVKFALVNAAGTTTYWSNDGTSTGGNAPTNAVALTVSNGLFSLLLGDTALTNMSSLPVGVFSNSDVRLRVWFNDGTNGEQLLSPDQRIAASGYAEMAAGLNLPDTNNAGTEGVITQGSTRLLFTKGTRNFFAGPGAGNFGVMGTNNTGFGFNALSSITTNSEFNTAIGSEALPAVAIGAFSNSAVGYRALFVNTSGSYNVATGVLALSSNTIGSTNTAVGVAALQNSTGSSNIALGYQAGSSLTTGSNNIDIGNSGVAGEVNTIRVGTTGTQTRAFSAGIRSVTTGVANAIPVLIDSNGQLGTASSSRRYKEDIADMGDASARIQALRPVTFRYRQAYDNGEKPLQYGLVAEEVAETFPELAVFNDAGEPETVKYQDLTPLLLNEVQKLRAEKDEMRAKGDELRARIEKLEALANGRDGGGAGK